MKNRRPVVALYAVDQDPETTSSMGIYHYTRNLIVGLSQAPEPAFILEIWVSSSNAVDLVPLVLPAWMRVVRVPGRYGRGVLRLFADHVLCLCLCLWRRPHGIHFPKGFRPFYLPQRVGCVVTLCDAIVDYYHENYPGVISRFKTTYFRMLTRFALRCSDEVITLSRCSADALCRLVPGVSPSFSIIPPGGMPESAEPRTDARSGILVFGSHLPHKGTALALAQLAKFVKETGFGELVTVVGVSSAHAVPGLEMFEGLRVNWAGRVTDSMLETLIRQSRVVIVASEIEGFGLPLLESYAVGTPVCYRNQSALAEVMQGAPGGWNAASGSFQRALLACLALSEQDILCVQADLARRYHWPDAIVATQQVYRRVVRNTGGHSALGLLAFCLIYPSLTVFKHLGRGVMLGYVLCALLLMLLFRRTLPIWRKVFSARRGFFAIGLGLLALVVAYLVIHPRIAMDGFTVAGMRFGASDADHALEVSLAALHAGRYPYYEKTFLGNPITPMPGALLLAWPFYLVGQVGFQNLFWLGLFCLWLARRHNGWFVPTVVIGLVMLLSPNVAYTIFTGGDYIANTIYVLLAAGVALEAAHRCKGWCWRILTCVFFGITLSSRANFVLLLPLWGFALLAATGRKWWVAMCLFGFALLAFVAITLPFYLYDPAGFSPLHTADKLRMGGRAIWAPICIPLLGGGIAAFLGSRCRQYDVARFLRDAFVVQATVVVAGFVLTSVLIQRFVWDYTHFGIFFMFFGVAFLVPLWLARVGRGARGVGVDVCH